jgi:hypothetical protein
MSESKSEAKTQRRSYAVFCNLATPQWTTRFDNIGFHPDHVIVRQVAYYDNANLEPFAIRTNLVPGDGIITTVMANSNSSPGSTFRVTTDIQSDITFTVVAVIVGPTQTILSPITGFTGNFLMMLEFVKLG